MNKILILGNLGGDAELRHTGKGTAVCNFSVATSKKWKGEDGELKEQTEWHRVSLFGKVAEALVTHLTKGQKVMVEGEMQYRDWEDKEGVKRTQAVVRAQQIELCGARKSKEEAPPIEDNEDDAPF